MKSLLLKVGLVVVLILCGYLAIVNAELSHAHAKEAAAKTAALAQVAKLNDALRVRPVKTIVVVQPKLVPFVEAAKQVGGTVVSHETSEVSIKDVETDRPTSTSWDDKHHRFHLDLPAGTFTRSQKFKYESIVIRGADGKARFGKTVVTEFDPVTNQVIDEPGLIVTSAFEMKDEGATSSSTFHPRLVFAANESLAVGVGVNFLDWHHAELSLLGVYDRKSKRADALIHVGYRLSFPHLDTNVSVGPSYSPFTKRLGAAVTLQITR